MRRMTKHDSGFKAAESYHMDTNPISHKATPDPDEATTRFIFSDLTKHQLYEGIGLK